MEAELDIRDEFIKMVVRGESFVDVGGLWRVNSEKLSVAHRYGAKEVTMFDYAAPEDPDWQGLAELMKSRNIPYNIIRGNLLTYTCKPFDIVHSSGMLYHMVNPLEYLKRLRTLSNKYAIVTSAITQELIQNTKGEYRVPPSGVIFMLALNESEKAILAEYWRPWGTVTGVTDGSRNFVIEEGGWLWLPTAASFKSMCQACRFEIIGEGYCWYGNAYTVLLR